MTTSEVQAERPQILQEQEDSERCPTCDAALPRGFRFCGQCGRALAATLAPAPGELLTIAFIDLEGFTTFASRVDEAEVRELIRAFHALVREQVGRHGGHRAVGHTIRRRARFRNRRAGWQDYQCARQHHHVGRYRAGLGLHR